MWGTSSAGRDRGLPGSGRAELQSGGVAMYQFNGLGGGAGVERRAEASKREEAVGF